MHIQGNPASPICKLTQEEGRNTKIKEKNRGNRINMAEKAMSGIQEFGKPKQREKNMINRRSRIVTIETELRDSVLVLGPI